MAGKTIKRGNVTYTVAGRKGRTRSAAMTQAVANIAKMAKTDGSQFIVLASDAGTADVKSAVRTWAKDAGVKVSILTTNVPTAFAVSVKK